MVVGLVGHQQHIAVLFTESFEVKPLRMFQCEYPSVSLLPFAFGILLRLD